MTTTTADRQAPAASSLSLGAWLAQTLKLSRPGFWPTHLWFFLLPMAEREMFGRWEFWLGAVYVCFPLGFLLYAWNDLFDAATDAHNPRKDSWIFGARPDAAVRAKIPALLVVTQLPFVVLFVVAGGPRMLGWFAALVVANAAYNHPRFGFKRFAVLDLLNQVGYLLVFVLASWLCALPQLSWPAMGFSALFAMHSHLFGQLMDLDEDEEAGRRSTAVALGARPSKVLLALMMLAEAAIAWRWFRGDVVAMFMAGGALFFVVDALFGPRRYPLGFTKAFFVGWNLIVVGTMYVVWRHGLFVVEG